jgi:hypothetical protein
VLGQNIGRVGLPDMASGGRPSLSFNFAAMPALDPKITFTRASTGTFFDSAGVLTSAANNAPRFDYNPSTLAARGLLIEEARTNLVLQSENFATTWGQSGSPTVSTNTTVAPDNTTTGDTIGSTVTASYVFQSITFTGDGTKAFSIFIKQGTSTVNRLFVRDTTAGINRGLTDVTWTVGVPSVVVTNGSLLSLTQLSNGWYRVQVAVDSVVAANSNQLRIQPDTATGTGTVILWGAQLENGAFPTSYIPTTVAQVTRNADLASVNTLSPWFNATEGTLFAEFSVYTSIGSKAIAGITDGTTNNRIQFFASAADPYNVSPRLVSGGVATNPSPAGSVTVGSTGKAALAYAIGTNQGGISVNGSAVNQSSPASAFGSVTQLELGKGSGLTQTNGYLRRITYYPRRLSNAELVSITS